MEKKEILPEEEIKDWLLMVPKENYISFDDWRGSEFRSNGWNVVTYDNKPLFAFFYNNVTDKICSDDYGPAYVALQELNKVNNLLRDSGCATFSALKEYISLKEYIYGSNNKETDEKTFRENLMEKIGTDSLVWTTPKERKNMPEKCLSEKEIKEWIDLIPKERHITFEEHENQQGQTGWYLIVDDNDKPVFCAYYNVDHKKYRNPYGPSYVLLTSIEKANTFIKSKDGINFSYTKEYYSSKNRWNFCSKNSFLDTEDYNPNKFYDTPQGYKDFLIKENPIKLPPKKSLSKKEIADWLKLVPEDHSISLQEYSNRKFLLKEDGWYVVVDENSNPLFCFEAENNRSKASSFGPNHVVLDDLEKVNEKTKKLKFSFRELKEYGVDLTEEEFRKNLIEKSGTDIDVWTTPSEYRELQNLKKGKPIMAPKKTKNKNLTQEQIKEYLEMAKARGAKTITAGEIPATEMQGCYIITAGNVEDYKPTDPIAIMNFNSAGYAHSITGPAMINLLPDDELCDNFYDASCCFENSGVDKIEYHIEGSLLTKESWEEEAKERIQDIMDAGFDPPQFLPENLLPESPVKKIVNKSTPKTSGSVASGFKATVKSDLSAVATRVAVKKSTELFSGLIVDFLTSNKKGSEATAMKKKVKDLLSTEDGKAAFQILIGALLPLMTTSDKIPESIKDVMDTVGKGFRTDGMTHFATEFVDYLSGPGAETVRNTIVKAFEGFKKLDEITNDKGEINVRAIAEPTLSLLSLPSAKEEKEEELEYVETDVSAAKAKLKSSVRKN